MSVHNNRGEEVTEETFSESQGGLPGKKEDKKPKLCQVWAECKTAALPRLLRLCSTSTKLRATFFPKHNFTQKAQTRVSSGWQMVQSNHERSTNKIGNAMEEVAEESLFNTPQSLNTGERPIKNAMDGFATSKRKYHFTKKVIGLWSSFFQDSKQTPEGSRQVYGVYT